jgi:hypothetical protein
MSIVDRVRPAGAVALVIAFLIACVLVSVPARASAWQDPAADVREIEAYRLTTGALEKVVNVNRAMIQEMVKDPTLSKSLKLRAEIDALMQKDDLTPAEEARLEALEAEMERLEDAIDPLGGDATSLAEMEARIRRFPPMMRALEREQMTPREYATFWLAFMQAAFVHGFQRSGMLKELPPGVSAENVQFIADHAAEIEAMQKELEAIGRQP